MQVTRISARVNLRSTGWPNQFAWSALITTRIDFRRTRRVYPRLNFSHSPDLPF